MCSLVISPEPPRPALAATRQRVEFTLRVLSELGPTCIAAPYRTLEERELLQALGNELGCDVITMLAPNLRSIAHRGLYKITHALRSLGGVSSDEHYTYFPQLHEKIQRWAKDKQPDFVLTHYWYASRYTEGLAGVHALDAHDIAYRALLQRGLLPQVAMAKARETAALRKFQLVFSINPDETTELMELSGARVELLPLAYKADEALRSEGSIQRNSVRFLGAMGSASNDDGINWFIREVFPRLLMEYPDAQFDFAGKDISNGLRQLAFRPSVKYHGVVTDPRVFWREAHVAVSPLRFGTGMKMKVIEAMGCGAAVAATRRGVDGVMGENGHHYLIADDAVGLAKAIALLLKRDELRNRMSQEAWMLVKKEYDPEQIRERMKQIVLSTLS